MHLRTALFALALIGVGFGLGWMGCTWRFDRPPLRGRGPNIPPIPSAEVFARLGLGEEQRRLIEAVAEEGRRREAPLREQVRERRREVESATDRGEDLPVLREKYASLLVAKQGLEKNHFETMMGVHKLLSPEQVRELRRNRPSPPPRPE